jgi:hypothetical protein
VLDKNRKTWFGMKGSVRTMEALCVLLSPGTSHYINIQNML